MDKSNTPSSLAASFEKLADVIKALRHPETGCPWDREQTHESLKPYLVEESYELLDAVDGADPKKISEELGDVLLQVMLHAQIGADQGTFSIEEVVQGLTKKLIDRHPHVFGDAKAATAEDVRKQWEKGKRTKEARNRILSGVPKALPALAKAQLIGEKVSAVHFDWPNAEEVLTKVQEEWDELLVEAHSNEPGAEQRCEEELGDLLFSLAQYARKRGLQAEQVLQKGCKKFTERFDKLEGLLDERGRPELSHAELLVLWKQVK